MANGGDYYLGTNYGAHTHSYPYNGSFTNPYPWSQPYTTTVGTDASITINEQPHQEELMEYTVGNGKATTFSVPLQSGSRYPQVEAYKVVREYEDDEVIAELLTRVDLEEVEIDLVGKNITVTFAEAPKRNSVTIVVR